MATYTWPVTLPAPRAGYQESGGALVLSTPTDKGPAKRRFRGKRPSQLSLTFQLTSAQIDTLQTFVESTIGGALPFNFTHPRTGAAVECRLLPTDDGGMWQASYLSNNKYQVTCRMEVMP